MSTVTDLKNAQSTAAVTYNTALANLYSAYVNLAALDAAIANKLVGGGSLNTFGGNLDDVRAVVLHSHPLASPVDPVPLSAKIATARDSYVASVLGG